MNKKGMHTHFLKHYHSLPKSVQIFAFGLSAGKRKSLPIID